MDEEDTFIFTMFIYVWVICFTVLFISWEVLI